MRKTRYIFLAAASAFAPSLAQASEGTVTAATGYLDTDSFGERFSDEPVMKLDAELDIAPNVSLVGYFYTGLENIGNDEGSEYGAELAVKIPAGPNTEVRLSVGRFANYQGGGFNAGDTYAKAAVIHGPVTASLNVLRGVSDTVLFRLSYSLPAGRKLALQPSLVYSTADNRLSVALSADYQVTDRFSVGGQLVTAKTGPYPYQKTAIVGAVNAKFKF